jgi:arylsulfatase A-like enzyme
MGSPITRREFLKAAGLSAAAAAGSAERVRTEEPMTPPARHRPPNIVFVFADQLRAQATGFGGDPNVQTPHLDRLAAQSLHFATAVSGCPVCSPARASLLTGQYPDRHGVFVNDVCLNDKAATLSQVCRQAGYETAYIGKWHLDGHGRSNCIPPERRQGFDFWRALECTHNYNRSPYYAGNDEAKLFWEGYDAIAQTREAQRYIRERAGEPPHPGLAGARLDPLPDGERARKPFLLLLSWGPPHNPYETAPERHRKLYDPAKLTLRANVPAEHEAAARKDLAGYYAHVTALDECIGELATTIREAGIEDRTLFAFWSDHGDMLHSHGQTRKQRPWDESILVPLLIRYPALLGQRGKRLDAPINTPDLMPTLLSLAGLPIPKSVDGRDYAPFLRGAAPAPADAALIACYHPFGEWLRKAGGKEYRGVRTARHTYVRDRSGPWLLYDNAADPCQRKNLVNDPAHAELQKGLDARLDRLLEELNDRFLPGETYLEQWGYRTDSTGTMPYAP